MATADATPLMPHATAAWLVDNNGSGYPIHRLVEAMQSYQVPGLKLPAPPADTHSSMQDL